MDQNEYDDVCAEKECWKRSELEMGYDASLYGFQVCLVAMVLGAVIEEGKYEIVILHFITCLCFQYIIIRYLAMS